MKPPCLRSIFNVTLFLCILLPIAPAAAVQVTRLTVGVDGYARAERWVPVVFDLQNEGQRFRGKIQVRKGQTIFEKSLDLGESSKKRIELLYYHTNAYESLRYLILDPEGATLREGNLEPRMLNYRDNLLLVVSTHEYDHQFLNGQENPWGGKTYVAYYKPRDLFSEWMGFSSADGIALGSLSPGQMLPAQWKAIAQHAAAGGVLVFSAITDFAVLKDPIYRNHLPRISPEFNQTSHGDFLVSFWVKSTTDPFPQLEIPAQSVVRRDCDRELISLPGGSSLVTSSPYYKGSIIYFAFDYTRMPEELRKLFARIWNYTVYPSTPSGDVGLSSRFRQKLDENPRVQRDLYNIPGLRLPDLKWFALFFFVYVCAIGPFQFLILKMMKKSSLLWISFPGIILLFTVASFGYTKYRQAGRGKITNVAVVEIFPELQQQTVYQVYGTVLSESGTFDFQAASESSYLRKTAIQSFNYQSEPFVLSEDLPRRLVGETMKRWTFRSFDAFDLQPQTFDVDVQFAIKSGILEGTVVNETSHDIEESFFMYDSRNSAALGTLKARSSKSFTIPLKSDSYPPFAEKHLRDLLHLYSASYSNPHFFLGSIDDSSGELIVNGHGRKTESTVYVVVYADSPDAMVINPWLLTTY
jgi:hypothetical protein